MAREVVSGLPTADVAGLRAVARALDRHAIFLETGPIRDAEALAEHLHLTQRSAPTNQATGQLLTLANHWREHADTCRAQARHTRRYAHAVEHARTAITTLDVAQTTITIIGAAALVVSLASSGALATSLAALARLGIRGILHQLHTRLGAILAAMAANVITEAASRAAHQGATSLLLHQPLAHAADPTTATGHTGTDLLHRLTNAATPTPSQLATDALTGAIAGIFAPDAINAYKNRHQPDTTNLTTTSRPTPDNPRYFTPITDAEAATLTGTGPSADDDLPERNFRWLAALRQEQELRDTPITRIVPLEESAIHEGFYRSYQVTFDDGTRGIYKPTSAIVAEFGLPLDKAQRLTAGEVAASRVDALFGFDLVPTTAQVDIPRSMGGQGPGSVQRWIEDTTSGWPVDWYEPLYRERAGAEDYIFGTMDRHDENYRTLRDAGLSLIDNGASFPRAPTTLLSDFVADRFDRSLSPETRQVLRRVSPQDLYSVLVTTGLSDPSAAGAASRLDELQRLGKITGEAWPGGTIRGWQLDIQHRIPTPGVDP